MVLPLSSANSSRRPSPLRPGSAYDPVAPMDDEVHPVIHDGRVAVITGAGSGIGRAAAVELAKCVHASPSLRLVYSSADPEADLCRIGLKIAIADVDEQGLSGTAKEVAQIVGEQNLIALPTDVTKLEQVQRLRDRVYDAWGEVS